MPSDPTRHRRAYIDWARGLAVLLMIEAHTFDSWTRPVSRAGRPFAYAVMLGGFAAPLFLWLSGVAVALFGASLMRRLDDRAAVVEAICRRGLEIFILAFLFRLQSFIVTPGGYLVTLFRVDILNIMGPAIAVTGLVWGLSSRRETLVVAYATLACALAMATPVVRSSTLVDTLPTWIQWYIRPSGEHTTFTLFPWAGFVFAGAACGVLLSQVKDLRSETRMHLAFAAAGVVFVGLGFYTAARPSIYPQSSFWTSSPTYFAIRVGVLTAGLAAIYAAARVVEACGGRLPVLERLGQHSLFVYWIHVELVYGYATWPLRRGLPFWGTAVAYVVFCALMYAAIGLRDRLVEGWRARRLRLYNAKNITV